MSSATTSLRSSAVPPAARPVATTSETRARKNHWTMRQRRWTRRCAPPPPLRTSATASRRKARSIGAARRIHASWVFSTSSVTALRGRLVLGVQMMPNPSGSTMSRPARLRYCLTVVSLKRYLTKRSVANSAIAVLTEAAVVVPRRNLARWDVGEQPSRRLFLRFVAARFGRGLRAVADVLSG
jgi:hypothetical protein